MSTPLPTLMQFRATRPRYELPQERIFDWLAAAHAEAQAALEGLSPGARSELEARLRKVLARCGCPPDKIAARGFELPDVLSTDWGANAFYDVSRRPRGPGSEERSRRFAELAAAYFEAAYAGEAEAPRDLIHVTCTGYVSPSAAQRLVVARGWGGSTRVTHAYHMGCYAALPAVRMAAGCFATATPSAPRGAGRVDIVHTEFCSLHLGSSAPSVEQFVVQSLFADGKIRYSMRVTDEGPGLRLLATHERLLPDSAGSMTWQVGDAGMQMTLSADVPARVAGALRGFVAELCALAGRDVACLRGAAAAVHPGGPKIIDGARDALELDEAQVRASREVLRARGNMSSATLPHIWQRVLDDPGVAPGALVLSLAFGPGLTICGALFEKA
jgi:predicted naringenin-chalcone synthase